MSGEQIVNSLETAEESIWLKATYHFHIFHYRMPDSVAIATVTPFVPSPSTIKMALVASLFQLGDINGAEIIVRNIHEIEVKIIPPKAALSFKAFLRYRSPPAVESEEKRLDETGSYYPSRPHIREYAIFQGNLEVYIKFPSNLLDYVKKALKNIRYLGSKDSTVTCFDVLPVDRPPEDNKCVSKLEYGYQGVVVLLTDFKTNIQIQNLEQLIPGNREEIYEKLPYTIPGNVTTKSRTKIFKKA